MAVVAASATAVQASTPASHRGGSVFWGDLAQPGAAGQFAALNSVSAVSPDDVWAVGLRIAGSGVCYPLVEHWNGTSWVIVRSPSPVGARVSLFNSVDALSATNVWAVGYFSDAGGSEKTLIEHWNGVGWRRVPSPNGSNRDHVTSVSAVSADDIWAVGYDDPPGPSTEHTLVLHWNGGSWSVVRTPSAPAVERGLFGISATTAASAWAVGATSDRHSSRLRMLVEHWNGERWHQAPITSPSADRNLLRSVSVVAPGNAWAVGERAASRGRTAPLVEHLSAGTWHQVRPPGLGDFGVLLSVRGDSPDDVWMVGSVGRASVLEHWDGRTWSLWRGPGSTTNVLLGVTTNGATATWAVGVQNRSYPQPPITFKERWNGHVWTR